MTVLAVSVSFVILASSAEVLPPTRGPATLSSARAARLASLQQVESQFLRETIAHPERIVQATISFREPVDGGALMRLARENDVSIQAMYHTTGHSSGGLVLRPGETVAQAIERDEETFRRILEDPWTSDHVSLMRTYGDESAVADYEAKIAAMRKLIQQHELRFYGMQIRSSVATISRLRREANIGLIIPTKAQQLSRPFHF